MWLIMGFVVRAKDSARDHRWKWLLVAGGIRYCAPMYLHDDSAAGMQLQGIALLWPAGTLCSALHENKCQLAAGQLCGGASFTHIFMLSVHCTLKCWTLM